MRSWLGVSATRAFAPDAQLFAMEACPFSVACGAAASLTIGNRRASICISLQSLMTSTSVSVLLRVRVAALLASSRISVVVLALEKDVSRLSVEIVQDFAFR